MYNRMSLFNHVPINFQQAELIEKDDVHYYQTPTGKVFPSITTILQKTMSAEKQQSLQNWKEQEAAAEYITQEAATIGTQTHKLIENHLNGITQADEVRLLSVAHFNNLLPFIQKINDIHGTELRMYSNEMKLAGMSDCIAKYDGELSIIDYKTKRSNQQEEWMTDHFIQGTAFCHPQSRDLPRQCHRGPVVCPLDLPNGVVVPAGRGNRQGGGGTPAGNLED